MKLIILFLFIQITIYAHKLNIFLDDFNHTLKIQSYFQKSSPCQNCDVVVSTNTQTIATLKTDPNGEAVFIHQSKYPLLNVKIIAGAGHQNEISYTFNNIKNDTNNTIHTVSTDEDNLQIWAKIAMSLIGIGFFFYLLKRIKKSE